MLLSGYRRVEASNPEMARRFINPGVKPWFTSPMFQCSPNLQMHWTRLENDITLNMRRYRLFQS